MKIRATEALMREMYARTILLAHNSPAPGYAYGWLKQSDTLVLRVPSLRIEGRSGLYGGPYKPLVGGRKCCGLYEMGSFSYSYSSLPEGVSVGRYCSISSGLRVLDSTHPVGILTTSAISFRPKNKLFEGLITPQLASFAAAFDVSGTRPMPVIEHDVWIGANVTLAMGVRIGTGAIVASGSVVTRDVPPYAIVAGNPAVVKKSRFPAELVEQLLASRWWEVDPSVVFSLDFTRAEAVCEFLLREGAAVARYEPQVLDLADWASVEDVLLEEDASV